MEIRSIYEEYCEEYETEFSDITLRKLMLVRTAVLLHPILQDMNLGFEDPVAVILDSRERINDTFQHILGFDRPEPYPCGSLTKKGWKQWREGQYEAVPVFCRNRKECEKMISQETWNQSIAEAYQQKLFFLIAFPDVVPEMAAEYFSGQIRIETEGYPRGNNIEANQRFVRALLDFLKGRISTFLQEIKKQQWKTDKTTFCYGMDPVYAAHIVLKSLIHEIYHGKRVEQELYLYETALEKLEAEWEISEGFDQWTELFRDRIYAFAMKWEGIIPRERVPGKYFKNIHNWPLSDQKFYYITQEDFEEISAPLAEMIGIHRLKSILADTGIIKCEGGARKYYTIKVPVITEYGAYSPQRRIPLRRSMLDFPGDLSIEELLMNRLSSSKQGVYPILGNVLGHEEEIAVSSTSNNQHIVILGGSGSGKTVSAKNIEKGLARQGAAVIVLNYNQTHTFKEDDMVTVINAKEDGIPMSVLEMAEDEDIYDKSEEIVDMFSRFNAMGSRQKAIFRKVCKQAVTTWDGEADELKVLKESLKRYGGEAIVDKYGPIFSQAVFHKSEMFWENGKITVIDFGDYSPRMQSILTGITLFCLWKRVMLVGQTMKTPLWIVCDEFQAIDSYGFQQLEKILREGRKFKTSLILSTQTLAGFDNDEKRLLQLPSTKLYFRPVSKDAEAWSRSISEETGLEEEKIRNLLLTLDRGSCVAVGSFQIAEGKTKALKMHFHI